MELLVSANDAKLVRIDGVDTFPDGAGPDTLSLIDLDQAVVVLSVPVQNSIVGPPQAVALSPDGALAVVAAPTSYDRAAGSLVFADVLQVVRLDTEPPRVEVVENEKKAKKMRKKCEKCEEKMRLQFPPAKPPSGKENTHIWEVAQGGGY